MSSPPPIIGWSWPPPERAWPASAARADVTRQRQLERALALVEGVADETQDADLIDAAAILRVHC